MTPYYSSEYSMIFKLVEVHLKSQDQLILTCNCVQVFPRLGRHLHDTGPELPPAQTTPRRKREGEGKGWRKEGREGRWWKGQGKREGIILNLYRLLPTQQVNCKSCSCYYSDFYNSYFIIVKKTRQLYSNPNSPGFSSGKSGIINTFYELRKNQ